MAKLKERQQQLRQEVILEAAQKLLEEQGYAALNMDDLANQVGISKATLYQHFSSKDELVIQVILMGMQEGEATVRALATSLSPIDRLEQILRYSIQKRIRMAITGFSLPPHLRDDPRIQEHRQRAITGLTYLIEQAKKEGSIRRELATPIVVHMFFGFFSPTYEELLRTGTITAEELSETLVSIFLKGICSH